MSNMKEVDSIPVIGQFVVVWTWNNKIWSDTYLCNPAHANLDDDEFKELGIPDGER